MLIVKEAVELGAAPARLQIELGFNRLQTATSGRERQVIEVSTFDQGPGGPMHAGTEGRVLLAPTAAATEGAKDATKVQVSHGPMVPKEGLPRPY